MKKLLVFAVVVLFGVWFVSVAAKGLGPPPSEVYEKLLGDSLYPVSRVEGFVRRDDGYDVHIRFRAEEDFVGSLVYRGFKKVDCDQVRDDVRFSPLRVAVFPPWLPELLEDVTCFRRRGTNAWSPNGRDSILAESHGGWIYFSGRGLEHDRAMPDQPQN